MDAMMTTAAQTDILSDDTLDGGEVLPGFACAVSEIFDV